MEVVDAGGCLRCEVKCSVVGVCEAYRRKPGDMLFQVSQSINHTGFWNWQWAVFCQNEGGGPLRLSKDGKQADISEHVSVQVAQRGGSGAKKRVLVVDDDEDICTLIKDVLGSNEYDVVSAYSGGECLDILSREKIDLVILDIMMPVMNGWETLDEMIGLGRVNGTKVLICSVVEADKQRKEQYRRYIRGYINKSDLLKDMREKVRDILGT